MSIFADDKVHVAGILMSGSSGFVKEYRLPLDIGFLLTNSWWIFAACRNLACNYSILHWGRMRHNDICNNYQISGITPVYSTACSSLQQRKHKGSAFLAHCAWESSESPHKGPVMWKMFLCDDVIMRLDIVYAKVDFNSMFWCCVMIKDADT